MRFDAYVRKKGVSTNRAVRKAIELLLQNESDKNWGDWINELEADPSFPNQEELRKDLKPQREDIL